MRLRAHNGFWQLTGLPRVFPISVYLVDDDGLTLIDTGLPAMAPGVLAAARRLGRPIRRIVLTHAHRDHAGALDRLAAALPRAEVACSAREAAVLGGDLAIRPGERANATGRLPGRFAPATTRPTRLVGDGDQLGPLTVVATPGHTPGHLSYFHQPSGALFAGDALQTRGGLAVAGDRRPLFPFVAAATWDRAVAVASARKIAGLPIRHLATAHGEVLTDPAARLRAAIARAASQTAADV
ncbi:MAG: MBL fold metallo-hydrolase [Propionibacteriaceae bacterium]|jgi:glyoxylase-like metal-dependent hydrolase (beta-lactamase superfamily II)|nr:MBL fold metallo-hydrolase [Propionibacteriaceae bacterium]